MISVYPSRLEGEPAERHQITKECTILEWMQGKVSGFDFALASKNISVYVNGCFISPERWGERWIDDRDDIVIYPNPQDGGPITAFLVKVAIAVAVQVAVSMLFKTKVPKSGSSTDGETLYEASASGNQVRYGDVIREVAGKQAVYPDYLVPPRRYFANEREQWLDNLLCVGKGYFQIPVGKVFIGQTPVVSLGDSVNYQIYEPGADLSGDNRHQWWQPSSEVGSTASATSGLSLSRTSTVAASPDASAFLFVDYEISIPSGAGEFPDGWESGMTARIESKRQFTIIDGGVDRDIIEEVDGAIQELEPFVGMLIEVFTDISAYYKVASYTPYSAGTAGTEGSPSTLTASGAPARYNYNITPATVVISLGATSYSVNLTTDVVNLAGLISAINAVLPSSIRATDFGGLIRVVESAPPYSGLAFSASGAVSDVFGGTPTNSTGVATVAGVPEQKAQITLDYTNGDPAYDLTAGSQEMCIGYSGLRYRLTYADTQAISVERLTDTGATDSGWGGFDERSDTSASIILDSGSLETGWLGPFAGCPEGETTSKLEIDFYFPGGLAWVRVSGSLVLHRITIEWQWRDRDLAGEWTSVQEEFTGKTRDSLGYTRTIDLPYPMRPEVRVRHLSQWADHTQSIEEVQWYGMKALLTGKTSYAGVTTLAISVVGGERLSGQTENQIWVEATRRLPRRVNGSWSEINPSLTLDFVNQVYEYSSSSLEQTRQIVDWFAYVAKSVGYTDDNLDFERLDYYASLWAERGDTFDYAYTSQSTVKEVLADCLGVGYAELTMRHGLLSMARDEARTVFEQGYSPQNILEDGPLVRKFSADSPTDYDGVDVEYLDEETWTTETIECRLEGDEGLRVEKISANGITDATRAWRLGMRRRAVLAYRRWSYEWTTEMDALNSEYLSYCPVSDDVPSFGQSALALSFIESVDGVIVESSEPFDWSAGGTFVAGIRDQEGVLHGPYEATQIDEFHFSIPSLDFTPDASWQYEPPHIMFGTLKRWSFPVLVSSLEPNGLTEVDCSAVNYDERVYQYDDAEPTSTVDQMVSRVLDSVAKHDVFIGRNTGDIEFNA